MEVLIFWGLMHSVSSFVCLFVFVCLFIELLSRFIYLLFSILPVFCVVFLVYFFLCDCFLFIEVNKLM